MGELALCLGQVQYFVLWSTIAKRNFLTIKFILDQLWSDKTIQSVVHCQFTHNFTPFNHVSAEYTVPLKPEGWAHAYKKQTPWQTSSWICPSVHFCSAFVVWCRKITWHKQGATFNLFSSLKPAFCLICAWRYDHQTSVFTHFSFNCLPPWFTMIKKNGTLYRHISGIIVALHNSSVVSSITHKA